METTTKRMISLEKVHRRLEIKKQVEHEAQERYKTDPEYRAIFGRLRKKKAERRANKQVRI